MTAAFAIDMHRDGDLMVVVIMGELDLATAPRMMEVVSVALAYDKVQAVHLDLSQVSFLDSSAISALVRIHQAAAAHDISVVLVHPRPAQFRTLQLMGLETLFAIETTTD